MKREANEREMKQIENEKSRQKTRIMKKKAKSERYTHEKRQRIKGKREKAKKW